MTPSFSKWVDGARKAWYYSALLQSLRPALRVKAAPLHLMSYKGCSALTERYSADWFMCERSACLHTHIFATHSHKWFPIHTFLWQKTWMNVQNGRKLHDWDASSANWLGSETVTKLFPLFFPPPGAKGLWRIHLTSSAPPRKLQRQDREWTSWAAPLLTM